MNWHGWIWPPGLSSSTAAKRWWYDYPHCRSENQGLEGLRESEWSSSPLAGTPTRGELELTWKRLVECRTHWATGHWVHLAGTWQSPDSPHTMTKKPKPQSQTVSLNRRHECGVSETCWGWRYGEKKSKLFNPWLHSLGEQPLDSLPLPVLPIQSRPAGDMTGWCRRSTKSSKPDSPAFSLLLAYKWVYVPSWTVDRWVPAFQELEI